MTRLTWSLWCGLCLTTLASTAAASATFPEALRKQLELDEVAGPAPGCRICHNDDNGGVKTAVKPLGRALSSAGAVGGSIPSFLAALATLDAERTDSDQDGAPDLEELRAGMDPNAGADGSTPTDDIALPQTGCALGGGSSRSGYATLLLLAFVLGARRLSGSLPSRARAACRRAP